LDELRQAIAQNKILDVEITLPKKKRSLDSNSYLWILCQKLAEKIGKHTKEDIYKEAIRKVGQFDFLAVSNEAAEQFIKVWNNRGLGWYAEETDSKIPGCKKIMIYYGSSCYDSKSMAVLVDYIVDECKELGIETMPEVELESLKEKWGKKHEGSDRNK
jgi:hypothetical protein